MAFQFQCPQCGNILQAEEFQAGQQSYCPLCGAMFLIPAPYLAPPSPLPGPGPAVGGPGTPQVSAAASPAAAGFPSVGPTPSAHAAEFPVVGPRAASRPELPLAPKFELREPDLLHIPCPQCKKMLETPVEMLDQDVLCPYCQAQFQLRRRDSVEFKRKKKQEAEIKEFQAGKLWLNLAIVAVVLVVLFLGTLIVWQVFG